MGGGDLLKKRMKGAPAFVRTLGLSQYILHPILLSYHSN